MVFICLVSFTLERSLFLPTAMEDQVLKGMQERDWT